MPTGQGHKEACKRRKRGQVIEGRKHVSQHSSASSHSTELNPYTALWSNLTHTHFKNWTIHRAAQLAQRTSEATVRRYANSFFALCGKGFPPLKSSASKDRESDRPSAQANSASSAR